MHNKVAVALLVGLACAAQAGPEGADAPRKLEGHKKSVIGVDFSKDGKYLVSTSEDHSVMLWNVDQGKVVWKFERGVGCVRFFPRAEPLALAFTMPAESGVLCFSLKPSPKEFSPTGYGFKEVSPTKTLAFSPDGKTLAIGLENGRIALDKSPPFGKETPPGVEMQVDPPELEGHRGAVLAIDISKNSKLLASGGEDKTVRLWDLSKKSSLGTLEGHQDTVRGVAFSPDGKGLASASLDKTVRIWDVKGQKELFKLEGHEGGVLAVAFSPDGKVLASAGADKVIRLWDAASGKPLSVLKGSEGEVSAIAFSPDGKLLAGACQDSLIRLWKLPKP